MQNAANSSKKVLMHQVYYLALAKTYKASWIKLYVTKYTKSGVISVDASGDPILPVFGIISCIWLLHGYLYFEVDFFKLLER